MVATEAKQAIFFYQRHKTNNLSKVDKIHVCVLPRIHSVIRISLTIV